MFCSNCGTQLPNDANFCLKCGQRLRAVASPQTVYEICEVRLDRVEPNGCILAIFQQFYCYFKAEVIGGGRRVIARTSDMKYSTRWLDGSKWGDADYFDAVEEREEYRAAVDSLIGELTKEDWQLLPEPGKYWYSYKLRK
jgi:hypothetical protein